MYIYLRDITEINASFLKVYFLLLLTSRTSLTYLL